MVAGEACPASTGCGLATPPRYAGKPAYSKFPLPGPGPIEDEDSSQTGKYKERDGRAPVVVLGAVVGARQLAGGRFLPRVETAPADNG